MFQVILFGLVHRIQFFFFFGMRHMKIQMIACKYKTSLGQLVENWVRFRPPLRFLCQYNFSINAFSLSILYSVDYLGCRVK
jgi:hypothetical protein